MNDTVTDRVRAAVKEMTGEFTASQIRLLVDDIERDTVRGTLSHLVSQNELRVVSHGGKRVETKYEATPRLKRTPTDLQAQRFAAEYLQALCLTWGSERQPETFA